MAAMGKKRAGRRKAACTDAGSAADPPKQAATASELAKKSPAGTARRKPSPAPAADSAGVANLVPLEFMLKVMRGEPVTLPGGEVHEPTFADRKWAAEKAAPYIHPRLQSVKHSGAVGLTWEEALEQLK